MRSTTTTAEYATPEMVGTLTEREARQIDLANDSRHRAEPHARRASPRSQRQGPERVQRLTAGSRRCAGGKVSAFAASSR